VAGLAPTEKRPLKQDLAALFQSPRELWIIFFAKFLESLGMFSMMYTVTLWLSKDFGLSDMQAGWWVGTYSTTLTLITFLIGFFADSWGFRSTLIVAFFLSLLARGTMSLAQTSTIAITGLMLLTIGQAGGVPVMNTAIRRYTRPETRAFAFSLYYVTFNVAAAVAGVLIDVAKVIIPKAQTVNLPFLGEMVMSQFRLVYMVGVVCALLSLFISLSLRPGIDVEAGQSKVPAGKTAASVFLWVMLVISGLVIVQLSVSLFPAMGSVRLIPLLGLLILVVGVAAWSSLRSNETASLMFSRLLALVLIVGAMTFLLADNASRGMLSAITLNLPSEITNATLLKWAVALGILAALAVAWLHRAGFTSAASAGLDPEAPKPVAAAEPVAAAADAPKASPLAIAMEVLREKPFWRFMLFVGLLVFVKLIFSHHSFTFPKYVTRELGEDFPQGAFQAINPILIIVLVPVATALTRHMSAFWVIVLGSIVTAFSPFVLMFGASYGTILGMILLLSLGECLWSPRLYEYTASIAPRGREASYMGLSSMPMFFAKMIVGPLSGWLLTRYCPEKLNPGEVRHSGTMWMIIGIMTLVGPLMILLLRKVIEGKGAAESEAAVSPAIST